MSTDIEQIAYTDIMPRVGELADELLNHPDEEVRELTEELLDWIDIFHREGLHRVVEMINAWRGEIFLEQVEEDEIIGPFLSTYDLAEAPAPAPPTEAASPPPDAPQGFDLDLGDSGGFS